MKNMQFIEKLFVEAKTLRYLKLYGSPKNGFCVYIDDTKTQIDVKNPPMPKEYGNYVFVFQNSDGIWKETELINETKTYEFFKNLERRYAFQTIIDIFEEIFPKFGFFAAMKAVLDDEKVQSYIKAEKIEGELFANAIAFAICENRKHQINSDDVEKAYQLFKGEKTETKLFDIKELFQALIDECEGKFFEAYGSHRNGYYIYENNEKIAIPDAVGDEAHQKDVYVVKTKDGNFATQKLFNPTKENEIANLFLEEFSLKKENIEAAQKVFFEKGIAKLQDFDFFKEKSEKIITTYGKYALLAVYMQNCQELKKENLEKINFICEE